MHTYTDTKYFGSSRAFVPERWLKKQDENFCQHSLKQTHPFAYLPIGFGVRLCVGKRITQMEIEVFLSRIFRRSRGEWHHGDLKGKTGLLVAHESELRFRLINI